MNTPFYELEATTLQGKTAQMKDFAGKAVLVVNTASQCGLTPQFEGLEKLYQKYKDDGLVIIGFPCNQFGNQEPGGKESIEEGCMINYGVTFPMMEKIEVNGEGTHPVFRYLKNELGGLFGSRIKWNFTKFLIDPQGQPVKRFAPTTKPEKIDKYIHQTLAHEE
ncbi:MULTISPECIES: glutathione peroxidase [Reichenbachiella]|uniref:Glutathione peroxidase n=1 Tax=Reichenbachiella agariperforans TaxID=156994 RepID=A0A1M6N3T3_REIAG|nr:MULTISPECIES: glutathione peroxidase [Reichenbachiella]MBU2915710.1 glutathione peroxidase [Reichenbachiella agariperforans]RJE72022.1 glutathione peroxidase [Reichenbachiella sp. MSK19-1]SHJ90357.1 glutathione peroxidase [Reichenbachiella agariperforans]